jgi:hypothetical protein
MSGGDEGMFVQLCLIGEATPVVIQSLLSEYGK